MLRPVAAVLVLAAAGWAAPAAAQSARAERAWKPLFAHEGLDISYLFYWRATGDETTGNGVVLRLRNTNDHAIRYRFKVVFRAGGDEHVEAVDGRLAAGEGRTGSADGLFWIPFPDGRAVAEVGLRGYRVEPE